MQQIGLSFIYESHTSYFNFSVPLLNGKGKIKWEKEQASFSQDFGKQSNFENKIQ